MKINHNEWAAPSFIILKKDGQVRFIYDSGRLNKQIKRTSYPLSLIKDMLNKLSIFYNAPKLFLIMGYNNISLNDAANKLCPISTTFVKYKYNPLPMGVCIALDIYQELMSALMNDLEFVRVYLKIFLILTSG